MGTSSATFSESGSHTCMLASARRSLSTSRSLRRLLQPCVRHESASRSIRAHSQDTHSAAIAVGANVGDRVANIKEALKLLPRYGIQVARQSRLYESAPAYVTDQPRFVNAALAVETALPPIELLAALKRIETELGRDLQGKRWGPRPLDLDIIFYEGLQHREEGLEIPHPRWQERPFVQAPLADLFSRRELEQAPAGNDLGRCLLHVHDLWEQAGGERSLGTADLSCFLPVPKLGSWSWQGRTQIMGILNITPDSFSDGGQLTSVDAAVQHARKLVSEGADVLDIGGQSTRPGADRLTAAQEAARVLPVIRALTEQEDLQHVPLSVDTFYAEVAQQAVGAGAHMVNDVSGGLMDPHMHSQAPVCHLVSAAGGHTMSHIANKVEGAFQGPAMEVQVAELGVPYIMMHMRGDPSTMQSAENTAYEDVCADVGRELQITAAAAMRSGIEPWRIIPDPGIGFAKSGDGNVRLIAGLHRVREQLEGPLHTMPMLVGPSRKGFLGRLTGHKQAEDRDIATAAASALCAVNGASIVRAHNVAAVRDAVRVADAVQKQMQGAH